MGQESHDDCDDGHDGRQCDTSRLNVGRGFKKTFFLFSDFFELHKKTSISKNVQKAIRFSK